MGFLAMVCAFSTPTHGGAQQVAALQGRVTSGGAPVRGARVTLVDPDGGRQAEEVASDGRFRVAGLAPGTYRVEVTAVGHRGAESMTVDLSAGEVGRLDVELEAEPIPIEGLKVVGVGRDRFEATYAITKTETEVEGEATRSWNPANPYDALRLVPGLAFSGGNRFGKPTRIRGADAWATPDVIEDFPSVREAGIGAEDGGFTADFGAMLPAIALAGIEVKKGSLGVLYGGDADGGVIVNRLKRGTADGSLGAWVETSPLGESLFMADAGGVAGPLDLYVAGKLLEGDYDEYIDEQGRILDDDDLMSGLARVGWEPSSRSRLEFIGVGGRDQIHYHIPQPDDPETELDETRVLDANLFRTTNSSAFYGATFDHTPSANLGWEAGFTFFRQRAERFSLTEGRAFRDRPETSNTAFGNVYWNSSPAASVDLSLKGGAEWTRHRQEEEANDSDKFQTFEDAAIFAASTVVLGDALTLSGGARYVHTTDDYHEPQDFVVHDLGVAWDLPGPGTRLVGSWTTGYSRHKGFAYFFWAPEEAGGYEVARTATLEASVEQALPSPWGDGRLAATVFRLTNDGLPIFGGSSAEGILTQDTESQGVELSANYPLGAVAIVQASYSWMESEIVATQHPDGANLGNTSGWLPEHTAALGILASPLPSLDVSLLASYDDGRRRQTVDPETDEVSIATRHGFTRINVATAWDVAPGVALRVRLENLLDETDLGYSVQTVGPDGNLTSEPAVARDPGRLLFVGFEVRWP